MRKPLSRHSSGCSDEGINQLDAAFLEIPRVVRRHGAAVRPGDRRDLAVRHTHWPAQRLTDGHDFAVAPGGRFVIVQYAQREGGGDESVEAVLQVAPPLAIGQYPETGLDLTEGCGSSSSTP